MGQHDHYDDELCEECDIITRRMAKNSAIKSILVAAKNLLLQTGWCQGQYSFKDGKPHYNFISGAPDSYCLVGAIEKVTYDLWKKGPVQTYKTQKRYAKLAYAAAHLVVELQQFNGCPADWNDQDESVQLLNEFTQQLKDKQIPRDKAKVEINKFKQELKAKNLPPVMTKEKVLAAIDYAIASC